MPADRPLVSVDDIQASRLGDDGQNGTGHPAAQVVANEALDAEEGEFLIDGTRQHEASSARRRARDSAPGKGGQHGRHAALDVTGAPAGESAVLDPRTEGRDDHVIGGYGVLMNLEDEGRSSPGRLVDGDDVVAQGGDALTLPGDAEGTEEVIEVGSDLVLEKTSSAPARGRPMWG